MARTCWRGDALWGNRVIRFVGSTVRAAVSTIQIPAYRRDDSSVLTSASTSNSGATAAAILSRTTAEGEATPIVVGRETLHRKVWPPFTRTAYP